MGNIINNSCILEDTIITDNNDSYERNLKDQEYLEYIKDHIAKVIECYNKYMVPLLDKNNISTLVSDEELKDAIIRVGKTIDTHDASKFSDSEFEAYRLKWYPATRELSSDIINTNEREDLYNDAWEHHYKVNAHHPHHWYNSETNTCTDMTLDAIVEMLCDWEAMSLKFNTSTLEWYENDAEDEKKCFTAKTKQIVEDLLYNVLHNS
jgi:hypothetical protein